MTPEAKVKKKISAILKKLGIFYFMPRGTAMGQSGIPDYICCVRGILLTIEAKAGRNKPTALQHFQMGRVQQAGGLTLVINERNVEILEGLLCYIIGQTF